MPITSPTQKAQSSASEIGGGQDAKGNQGTPRSYRDGGCAGDGDGHEQEQRMSRRQCRIKTQSRQEQDGGRWRSHRQ